MKKVFKIIGIILLIFLLILVAIPFVLESKIDAIAKGIDDFFVLEKEDQFIAGVRQEKTKYGWDKFIAAIAKLYQ